jgi:NAD(P)-dependent dehydrogenase (short-subunit alcohol dehydrogenase family)
MAGRLAGKTAFVTGAASGIGRQVALRFHNEGARVAFADRDYDGAKVAVSGRGERARAVEVDIADEDSVTTADAIVINDGWRPLVSMLTHDADAHHAIVGRIPMGRSGAPEDVEGVMVFLPSDQSGFATGASFAVDGGMSYL